MSGTVSPTRVDVVIQGQGPSWEFVEGAILEDEAEEVVLPQSQRPEPKPYLLPIGAGISLLKFTPVWGGYYFPLTIYYYHYFLIYNI